MHNVDFIIDFIQSSKKQYVNLTIGDDRIKKGLYNFVDKQTELCKIVNKNSVDFTKIFLENFKIPNSCNS